jgi:hypothetical protein
MWVSAIIVGIIILLAIGISVGLGYVGGALIVLYLIMGVIGMFALYVGVNI